MQRAVQHIYPRLAYAVSATYRHAITTYEGSQFITNGTLYLPGLMSAHNLLLSGSFQERDTLSQVSFGNRFAYSRGIQDGIFQGCGDCLRIIICRYSILIGDLVIFYTCSVYGEIYFMISPKYIQEIRKLQETNEALVEKFY